jgi:hypothetical protein
MHDLHGKLINIKIRFREDMALYNFQMGGFLYNILRSCPRETSSNKLNR